jgi:hypothetical protein
VLSYGLITGNRIVEAIDPTDSERPPTGLHGSRTTSISQMSRQSIASLTEILPRLPVNRVSSEPAIRTLVNHRASPTQRLSITGSREMLSSTASLTMMNTSIVNSLLDSQMRVFHRDLDWSLYKNNIGAFDLLEITPHESNIADFVSAICENVNDNDGFMCQLDILHQGLLDLFARHEAKKSKGIFKN